MNPTSTKIMLTHLDWTIQRLDEILKRENTPYYRSAALQRFGLTYEMALKCIESFKTPYGNESLEYPEIEAFEQNGEWLELVDAYKNVHQRLNVMSGGNAEPATENQMTAAIYNNLNRYCLTFQNLYKHLVALTTNRL